MREDLDKKLVKAFPLLYGDRDAPMQASAMCWGFECADGWFDIIWDLSWKLEPVIQKFIDDNPDMNCSGCGCDKNRHYGWKHTPGKCLAIHIDAESAEEPPNNYLACHCEKYRATYPRAAQVKEKFGGLRFYMTCGNDEIYDLTDKAEALSYKVCEECGDVGSERPTNWTKTLCDTCFGDYEAIRLTRWAKEEDGEQNG